MAQYKYQLKTGHTPDDTFIPGIRISEEGIVESDTRIESPVLESVGGEEVQPAPAPVQAPAPAAPAPQVTTNTETKEQQ